MYLCPNTDRCDCAYSFFCDPHHKHSYRRFTNEEKLKIKRTSNKGPKLQRIQGEKTCLRH